MKKVINTYQTTTGSTFSVEAGTFADKDYAELHHLYTLIGTEEREFTLPKKMVTGEAITTNIARTYNGVGSDRVEFEGIVPSGAKNLRVTYDIEETLPT